MNCWKLLVQSQCPNEKEMHKECVLKMNRLHYHDVGEQITGLSWYRMQSSFLDKTLVHYAMYKMVN